MDVLDLGATGQVYDVYGNGLHTRKECILHNAGGIIKDSDFHVASREDQPPLEGRRLICPAGLRFRRVSWTLHADEHGVCRGLKLEDHPDRTCIAYFVDNTFRADGPVTEGEVFTSSAGDPQNRVRMIAFGCHYERPFGESEATPIAVIDERGAWTFLLADLGGLDPEVAFRVTDRDNLALKVI